MGDKDAISGWLAAAGLSVTEAAGGLSVAGPEGGQPTRVLVATRDEPVRFVSAVDLDTGNLTEEEVEAALEQASLSRGALVEVRPAPAGAEIAVTIYPDGLTRHATLAAVDEIAKSRLATRTAVDSASGARRLRDLLAGEPSRRPEASAEETGEPVQATGAAVGSRAADVAGAVQEPTQEAVLATGTQAPEPERQWCYVQAPAEIRDLSATDQVIGHLQTGVWHEVVDQQAGWTRVRSAEGAEGWVESARLTLHDPRA